MSLVNKEKDKIIPKTEAKFDLVIEKDKTNFYRGTLLVYDSFKTKNIILLYVDIESKLCEKTKNYTCLFRFSRQPFQDSIRKKLNEVKIKKDFCN